MSDILISVVNVLEGETLPPVDTLSGVIITGSHGMVTDNEAWMLVLASYRGREEPLDSPLPPNRACSSPARGSPVGSFHIRTDR